MFSQTTRAHITNINVRVVGRLGQLQRNLPIGSNAPVEAKFAHLNDLTIELDTAEKAIGEERCLDASAR